MRFVWGKEAHWEFWGWLFFVFLYPTCQSWCNVPCVACAWEKSMENQKEMFTNKYTVNDTYHWYFVILDNTNCAFLYIVIRISIQFQISKTCFDMFLYAYTYWNTKHKKHILGNNNLKNKFISIKIFPYNYWKFFVFHHCWMKKADSFWIKRFISFKRCMFSVCGKMYWLGMDKNIWKVKQGTLLL